MNQSEKVARFRLKNRNNKKWYSGAFHLFFNGTCLVTISLFSFFQISDLQIIELILIPIMLIIGKLYPRDYDYVQKFTQEVDVTPWKHTKKIGLAICLIVIGIYIYFA